MNFFPSKHVHFERSLKLFRYHRVQHIHSAGIGPKAWQDRPCPVGNETTCSNAPTSCGDRGLGVEVTGEFARGRPVFQGLVSEDEGSHSEFVDDLAAKGCRRVGVVVAGDPGPAAGSGQPADCGDLLVRQACGGFRIVETVAEADDVLGLVRVDNPFQCG